MSGPRPSAALAASCRGRARSTGRGERSAGRAGRSPSERGAGTVLVLALAGLLLTVTVGATAGTGLLVAHRRAGAAADLAALAGAFTRVRQGGDVCAVAGRSAADNGARLRTCTLRGEVVRVEVGVAGPRWFGRSPELVAVAEAGPS